MYESMGVRHSHLGDLSTFPLNLEKMHMDWKYMAYIPPVKLTVYDLFSTHTCILDCFQFLL